MKEVDGIFAFTLFKCIVEDSPELKDVWTYYDFESFDVIFLILPDSQKNDRFSSQEQKYIGPLKDLNEYCPQVREVSTCPSKYILI